MPGTRYSVFNPEGESFVPEQDRFNAQLQQSAMSNMAAMANINENAREFNINDQGNRWKAQADYGYNTQKLQQSGQQFNVLHDMMAKQALAQLAYQNKSLDAQYEGPRAEMAMQKEQWNSGAPTRALQNQVLQGQAEEQVQRGQSRQRLAKTGLDNADPSDIAFASGGDPLAADEFRDRKLQMRATPLLQQLETLRQQNTPAARTQSGALRQQLIGMGYKYAPLDDPQAKSIEGFAGSDPEFATDLGQGVDAFKSYVGGRDHFFGHEDQGQADAFTNNLSAAQKRAIDAGYPAEVINAFAKQRLAQAISDKRVGMLGGNRTPYGASNIDSLTTKLGLGSLTGGSPLAQPAESDNTVYGP